MDKRIRNCFIQPLKNNAFPALFLSGDLGAGKTTLVSELVKLLENGQECEIASPSFNICNIYPCTPEIMHWDLYRCGNSVPSELLEALDEDKIWNIVEWGEYVPEKLRPIDYLDIKLELNKNMRLLDINGQGKWGRNAENELLSIFHTDL